MPSVVVLGASGMLGSMVVRVLAACPDLHVRATTREGAALAGVNRVPVDALAVEDKDGRLDEVLTGADWAVNAIGLIKPHISDCDASAIARAIRVNAAFPHRLAQTACRTGTRVLQIATDCVYAGTRGGYTESSVHDAHDVYGKTKSLGEVPASHVHHIRASIVGPEAGRVSSLLEWFRSRPRRTTIPGYLNHRWNGVTTLQFARVCAAIVRDDRSLPAVQHLVPADIVAKYQLLEMFRRSFGRTDVTVDPVDAAQAVDRSLATERSGVSECLWRAAGYPAAPTIEAMGAELAAFID
jgi:dTDP-4-dehydrorhamnose reductase